MAQPASKSIEELLAADDDLKFFDDVNGDRYVSRSMYVLRKVY